MKESYPGEINGLFKAMGVMVVLVLVVNYIQSFFFERKIIWKGEKKPNNF
jgi:hypothetical protein